MTCWIPFAHLNADSHSDQDAGFLLMDAIFLPASHSSGLSVILLVREFREDEEEECRARSCSHDISSARVWGQLPQPSILKKECLQPPSC